MTFITATVTKETKETKVGIAFTRRGEEYPLTVKLVREGGLFSDTDLKPGMVIDSINDEPMKGKSPKEAADALRMVDGDVTVVAKVSTHTITKASKEDKVGISLKNSTTKPGMWISKINEDGKFAGSELKVGQQVIMINGMECPSKTKEAIKLVKDAESELTIVAVDAEPVEEEEEPAEEPVAAAPSAPVEDVSEPAPVEEKKEEHEPVPEEPEEEKPVEESKDRSAPLEEEAAEGDDKDKKGLLDTVFSACIC